MRIGERIVGPDEVPHIVADISASHNGDLQRGFRIIEAAKAAGADAVKFQAYLPEGVSINADRPEFLIKEGPWAGRTLFDLYQEAHTPRWMLEKFFEHANEIGITAFSTACAPDDVDFLETLGNPVYKIASLDIGNLHLIEHAAKTGKPVIVSTGMASEDEIWEAYETIEGENRGASLLLHCVSAYPHGLEDARIGTLRSWQRSGPFWGYSDHTIGIEAACMAVALGAVLIEKHLTLSRSDTGPDDHFASEPDEFAALVKAVHAAHAAMRESEHRADDVHLALKPSIWCIKDIAEDERFTAENVRIIRPAGGLPARDWDELMTLKAVKSVRRGAPIAWRHAYSDVLEDVAE
jgi:N-acetylneuraminate synthase